MTTLKQGDLIKDKGGNTSKVVGVCGAVIHFSFQTDHDTCWSTQTESQLKNNGYTWDTPAWEPRIGDEYYYLNGAGETASGYWDDYEVDHNHRDFLGIYQTKELCEASLLEIRRKLGK